MSLYCDWFALSELVDMPTAQLINRVMSDGVIAPGYETAALEILCKKKKGKFVVLQIDPCFEPKLIEPCDVYGINFEL